MSKVQNSSTFYRFYNVIRINIPFSVISLSHCCLILIVALILPSSFYHWKQQHVIAIKTLLRFAVRALRVSRFHTKIDWYRLRKQKTLSLLFSSGAEWDGRPTLDRHRHILTNTHIHFWLAMPKGWHTTIWKVFTSGKVWGGTEWVRDREIVAKCVGSMFLRQFVLY